MLSGLLAALGATLATASPLLAAPGAEEPGAFIRHLAALGHSQAPAPSPDGSRLAFVTTLFGSPQVAVMPLDGGFPQQLTDEPGGILSLHYSTVDPHLLVAVARRGDDERLLFVDDQVAGTTEVDSARGNQLFGGFSRDGKKLLYATLEGSRVTLHLLALDTRKPTDLLPPKAGAPAPPGATPPAANLPLAEALPGLVAVGPISADGRVALLQVSRQQDESIYLLDLSTVRAQLITPHDKPARFRLPRFSPDGRTVYLLTDQGRAVLGVEAVSLANLSRRVILAGPHAVEAFALSDDGHRLVAAQDADGETLLSQLELPSLRPQPMPLPPGGALQLAPPGELPMVWTRGGDRLIFAWRLAADTTDLWTIRLGYGVPARLTHSPHPGIALEQLARPAQVRLQLEGAAAGAWLWRPEKGEKQRAAIFLQERARPLLNRAVLALLAEGFAVLEVSAKDAEPVLEAGLRYLQQSDLDPRAPLLVFDAPSPAFPSGILEKPQRFSGVAALGAQAVKVQGVPVLELREREGGLADLAKFAREQLK